MFAALLACGASAQGGVVFYDQGLTAAQQASTTSLGATSQLTNFTQADEFTLTSSALWTDVHFWTLEATNATAPSVIQFYLWNSLTVGGDADTGRMVSGYVASAGTGAYTRSLVKSGVSTPTTSNLDRYYYSFDLATPVQLAAGTYYLGLHFGPANVGGPTVPVQVWEYQSAPEGTGSYYRARCLIYTNGICANFETWNSEGAANKNEDLAFRLTTRVPEPGSLALLAIGLLGVGAGARRRR